MQAPLGKRKRKRRARTWLDLGILFLYGLADFVVEFLPGFFEFTHAAAEAAGEFGKLLGAEEEEDGDEDEKPFLSARHAECEDVCRVHLILSLGVCLGVVKGKFRRIRSGSRGGFWGVGFQNNQRLPLPEAVRQFSRMMPVIST